MGTSPGAISLPRGAVWVCMYVCLSFSYIKAIAAAVAHPQRLRTDQAFLKDRGGSFVQLYPWASQRTHGSASMLVAFASKYLIEAELAEQQARGDAAAILLDENTSSPLGGDLSVRKSFDAMEHVHAAATTRAPSVKAVATPAPTLIAATPTPSKIATQAATLPPVAAATSVPSVSSVSAATPTPSAATTVSLSGAPTALSTGTNGLQVRIDFSTQLGLSHYQEMLYGRAVCTALVNYLSATITSAKGTTCTSVSTRQSNSPLIASRRLLSYVFSEVILSVPSSALSSATTLISGLSTSTAFLSTYLIPKAKSYNIDASTQSIVAVTTGSTAVIPDSSAIYDDFVITVAPTPAPQTVIKTPSPSTLKSISTTSTPSFADSRVILITCAAVGAFVLLGSSCLLLSARKRKPLEKVARIPPKAEEYDKWKTVKKIIQLAPVIDSPKKPDLPPEPLPSRTFKIPRRSKSVGSERKEYSAQAAKGPYDPATEDVGDEGFDAAAAEDVDPPATYRAKKRNPRDRAEKFHRPKPRAVSPPLQDNRFTSLVPARFAADVPAPQIVLPELAPLKKQQQRRKSQPQAHRTPPRRAPAPKEEPPMQSLIPERFEAEIRQRADMRRSTSAPRLRETPSSGSPEDADSRPPLEFVVADSPSLLSGLSEDFTSVSQDLPRPPRRSSGGGKKKKSRSERSDGPRTSGDIIGISLENTREKKRPGPQISAPLSASDIEQMMMRKLGGGGGKLHPHAERSDEES